MLVDHFQYRPRIASAGEWKVTPLAVDDNFTFIRLVYPYNCSSTCFCLRVLTQQKHALRPRSHQTIRWSSPNTPGKRFTNMAHLDVLNDVVLNRL